MTPVTVSKVISNRNEPYLMKESISLLPSHFETLPVNPVRIFDFQEVDMILGSGWCHM